MNLILRVSVITLLAPLILSADSRDEFPGRRQGGGGGDNGGSHPTAVFSIPTR